MEQERKRVKRAAVSDETRHGRRRAAVNPNARRVDEVVETDDAGRTGERQDAAPRVPRIGGAKR